MPFAKLIEQSPLFIPQSYVPTLYPGKPPFHV